MVISNDSVKLNEKDDVNSLVDAVVDSAQRRCILCGKLLSCSHNPKESDFYQIKAKDEKNIRWEDNCKQCKKEKRKKRKEKNNEKICPTGDFAIASPELQKTDNSEAHKHPQNMIRENTLDNESSTKEGIINFNKFVSVLMEEYGKQVGASVYVKGKRS